MSIRAYTAVSAMALASLACTEAAAHLVVFYAQLDGRQMVPATPSLATGTCVLTYNEHHYTYWMDLYIEGISMSDLVGGGPNNTPISICMAPIGENGPIVLEPVLFGELNQVGDTLHLHVEETDLGGVQGSIISDLFEVDAALWEERLYFIVRTAAFPDGEIRGQILGNCRADVNDDGFVDTLDVISFLALFNDQHPDADFDGNGFINTLDFIDFLNSFNLGC